MVSRDAQKSAPLCVAAYHTIWKMPNLETLPPMPIVDVRDLTKIYRVVQKKPGLGGAIKGLFRREYKTVRAVDGVTFSIEPGEMVAFLGPNGAGKTTTLKMLSGLIFPTSGSASVLGFTPWERADTFPHQFALVMGQKNQLWWDLPAADSFQLHREIYSLPAAPLRTPPPHPHDL